MNIRSKMNSRFRSLEGGLFSDVTKADVGEGAMKLMEQGVDIMAWADPFFPDPSLPASVKETMQQVIEEGTCSHYSMPIGLYDLRKTLSDKVSRQTGLELDPSRNIIVSPGSDSGLIYAMMPFIEPGDEVLIPEPCYPSNILNPKLLGGTSVTVPLLYEDNYQIRIKEFEKRLTDKTKMVLITHPNNPTTTVFRRESVEALSRFVIENDLILVSDQAFEDHIYDGIEFVHPATLPGMWERTLTVCSISKGIGLSGFRIGYIYGSDVIMDVLYGGAVNILGAPSTISSLAAITAVEDDEVLKSNFGRLERRRRMAYEIFSSVPGVEMRMPESGILTWIKIEALGTSAEVAAYLLEHARVLVNEGVPYGEHGEGYLRIVTGAFADDKRAEEAFKRIRNALIQLGEEKRMAS